ncbi:cytidine deaminase [Caballeronia arationis]|uniref:tRNA(Arg) A34 adenosine deaminase TadA n=1 Tax=Caballeronia arationis TaxID=1777142 RepID=A0A7Z7I5P3_9BURK|nr:deaminase [Caballeronia arationis]SAK69728.1 cytidine deaminase [Caballeronia arationis]SOE64511.1 tRNA(Arg) A34 adenosine deaminase TadA [Caballeronia arationis]
MYDDKFMDRALALSAQALTKPGTEPFGAVVVRDGVVVGEGINHSVAHWDPTSHGETEAIRDACRRLETVDLSGCELYTSCEPCALCVAAMKICGIGKLYYGASLAQSGKAFANVSRTARRPIDIDELRDEAGGTLETRSQPSEQKRDAEAVRILEEWAASRSS